MHRSSRTRSTPASTTSVPGCRGHTTSRGRSTSGSGSCGAFGDGSILARTSSTASSRATSARRVGGSGLHTRAGEGALEIGYWIRASAVGRGYAREATAALARVAIRVCAVDRVEIRVDPANEASLRIPRALGFAEEATLRRRLPAAAGEEPRDAVVFAVFADELDRTPVAQARLEAFDALGRSIPL